IGLMQEKNQVMRNLPDLVKEWKMRFIFAKLKGSVKQRKVVQLERGLLLVESERVDLESPGGGFDSVIGKVAHVEPLRVGELVKAYAKMEEEVEKVNDPSGLVCSLRKILPE
ncbi:hypothetical protein ACLOJK_027370, partial [Asimina triloba]